ncbi:MAG: 3-deoxy-D-manno-octulosonate 8-phosphate phosphatase [Marinilabiliales bacterium]|jgi:3-deoxy-D-manno-octulosonate 8-phosphate phosphatase (KDO 8-P phosphatase)|nr:MAG: 3-deoxy-D-manno-octulosonate 8-phosphate phosphatase [Marinilabiliales bacterium]
MSNYKALLTNVKTFVFDYDGVMTNGNLLLQMDGQPLRFANVKDGFVLQLAVKLGYRIVVISGGFSKSVETRFEALGIKDVFLGIRDKLTVFDEYIQNNQLDPSTIVYMGDDLPDYKVMQKVGVPVCPADAAEEIKDISVYISDKKGGEGCVRDIIEQVLKVQGKWMSEESHHW